MSRKLVSHKNLREDIIQAALMLYSQEGVSKVKANQIAKKANVDPPLVSYYFKTSDDLFYAVIEKILEDLKEWSTSFLKQVHTNMEATLIHYCEKTTEWAFKNPKKFSLWMYFYYLASFDQRFSDLNTRIRLEGRSRITAILYKGIVEGTFKAPTHTTVEDLATLIQSYLSGQIILQLTENTEGTVNLSPVSISWILRQIKAS